MKTVLKNWWLDSGGVPYDSDYQAVLDRGTALGYTLPSAAQQILQNDLVVALKASGSWDLLDVFYVFANDSSLNFGRINWKDPDNFLCSITGLPSFTSNKGFGRVAASVVDTGWIPATHGVNYTQNSSFIHTSIADALSPAGNDMINCGTSPGARISLFPSGADYIQYFINDSTVTNQSLGSLGTQKAGQYFSIRTASNSRKARTPDGDTPTNSTVSTGLANASLKSYSSGSNLSMRQGFISAGSASVNFAAYESDLNNYIVSL